MSALKGARRGYGMSPSAITDGGSPTHAIGAHPQTEGLSPGQPCLQEGGKHRDIKGQAWMPYKYKLDGWGRCYA